jgi:hypothetical protein
MEGHVRSEVGPVVSVQAPGGPPAVEPAPLGGSEWGVASLTLGAVFAVMLPPAVLLVFELDASRYQTFSRSDARLAALGGSVASLCILGLAGTGVTFGFMDMLAAARRQRPIALGLTGILLNGMDLLLWLATSAAWLGSIFNVI